MPPAFDPYYRWLGIPPEEQPPNHYRLLGLRLFEADADVIETAADRQMRHIQTFKTGQHSALSQKLLNEIAAARLCLISPAKKAGYDAQLQAAAALPVTAAVAAVPRAVAVEEAAPPVPQINTDFGSAGQLYRQKNQTLAASRWMMLAVGLLAIVVFAAAAWLVWRAMPTAPQLPLVANQALDEGQALSLEMAPADMDQRKGKLVFDLLNGSPSGVRLDRDTGNLSWVPDESHGPGAHRIGVRASVVGSPHLFHESAFQVVVAEVQQPPQLEPVELKPLGRGALQAVVRAKDPDLPKTRLEYSVRVSPSPTAAPVISAQTGQFAWRPAREDTGKEYQITFRATKEGLPQQFSEQTLTVKLGNTAADSEFGRDSLVTALKATGVPLDLVREEGQAVFGGRRFIYRLDNKALVNVTEYASAAEAKAFLDRLNLAESRFGGLRLAFQNPTHFYHKERVLLIYSGPDPALLARLTEVLGTPLGIGQPATAQTPQTPSVTPQPSAPVVTPETPKRLPLPDDRAVSQSLDEIRKTYEEQYKQRKPADRIALARTLYTDALKIDDDPTARCAMLQESSELAVSAGNLIVAWQALDMLIAFYKVDAFEVKLDALKRVVAAGRNNVGEQYEAAQRYGELIELAARDERFDDAISLLNPALNFAQRAKDGNLASKIQRRRGELQDLKKAFEAMQAAEAKLKSSPDDATANLHLGSFLCFWRNQWDQGLPLLAKAAGKLGEAARLDVATPADARKRQDVGEAWLQAAEGLRGLEKEAAHARAEHWLRLALPQLSDLEQKRVENRIKSLPPRTGPSSLAELAPEIESQPETPQPPDASVLPPPARSEDTDRRAAETVLKSPASAVIVQVGNKTMRILQAAGLPAEPFIVRSAELAGSAIDDSVLAQLGSLQNLNSLQVRKGTSVTDAGMAQLARMGSLSSLTLAAESLSDAALAHLPAVRQLQFLDLSHGRYSAAGLARLSQCRGLMSVLLTNVAASDEGVQYLAGLPLLQRLSIVGADLSASNLNHLATLANLRYLTLESTALSNDALASVVQCAHVHELALRGNFGDEAWRELAKMTALKRLTLDSPKLTCQGIDAISTLVNVETLILRNDGPVLTDEALAILARLPKLEELSTMHGEQLTDTGLASLGACNSLQRLTLYHARQISDGGLAPIARLPNLKSVQLYDAQNIKDAGLMHFGAARQLQMLSIYGSQTTPEGIQALRALLSSCTITIRK